MNETSQLITTVASALIMFWWAQSFLLMKPKQKYFNWAIGGAFILQSIFQIAGLIVLQLLFFGIAIGLWYFQAYLNKKFDKESK